MSAWHERPREEANLLNPPFCSLLITLAIEHFQKNSNSGMPYVYAHLILPMVLHKATREAMPRSTLRSLSAWLEEYPALRAGLADKVISLKPFVRDALLYGMTHGCLSVDENGLLGIGKKPRGIAAYELKSSNEVRDCIKRAQFTGRWLATAGSIPTVMALWGIHP
jgi:Family of unknown function (DUF6521)